MKIQCIHCSREIEVKDGKVPAGRFKLKCPGCATVGVYEPPARPAATEPPAQPEAAEWEKLKPYVEAYMDRRLQEFRSQLRDEKSSHVSSDAPEQPPGAAIAGNGKSHKSLVCEPDPKIARLIAQALQAMGYEADVAKSVRESLQKIERQTYAIVTTNLVFPGDPSGGKNILRKINSRKIEQRRETFAVLLSQGVATAGSASAFLHGANITVNLDDLKNLPKLIEKGQEEFNQLFQQ